MKCWEREGLQEQAGVGHMARATPMDTEQEFHTRSAELTGGANLPHLPWKQETPKDFMRDCSQEPPCATLAHPGMPLALENRKKLGLFHKCLSPLSLTGSDHQI